MEQAGRDPTLENTRAAPDQLIRRRPRGPFTTVASRLRSNAQPVGVRLLERLADRPARLLGVVVVAPGDQFFGLEKLKNEPGQLALVRKWDDGNPLDGVGANDV